MSIFRIMDPQAGPILFATGSNTFNLGAIGFYQVLFQVSVDEAGQLVLTLDEGSGAAQLPIYGCGASHWDFSNRWNGFSGNHSYQCNTHCAQSRWGIYSFNHNTSCREE